MTNKSVKFYPTGYTSVCGDWISNYSEQEGSFKIFKFRIYKFKRKYRLTIRAYGFLLYEEEGIKTIKKSRQITEDFIQNFSDDDYRELYSKHFSKENRSITLYKNGNKILSSWVHSFYKIQENLISGIYHFEKSGKIYELEKTGSCTITRSSNYLSLL